MTTTTKVKLPKPPVNYDYFVSQQTMEHERKNHDYQSRFMRGLLEHGRGVWDWEVDKKLDRIRTWIERSELWVKSEGIHNSVGDLFNYTVQFAIYLDCRKSGADPLTQLSASDFYKRAVSLSPAAWVDFLISEGRIQLEEKALQNIIRYYMGDEIGRDTWLESVTSDLKART